ncbi:MAG TPA: MarR family transcriptional regulator [Actinophytocola sp.]|jgi:protein-tyrosine-phosphatase/DNA-binding transcriptional ArsR family regulator|uniref:arsenate reductase/protein-tyrosine-phosphatase family protein n=1 Tax=Actinophytocola sp. TaxID=1872138 RepID=UPI002DF89D14|nr:MarR family transcriptional regulator [Actinophytocola sp.]
MTPPEPPPFVRMAADPLRWRLLWELARSDRRVRELVTLSGQPQNLVSYHLGRLRTSGLVGARRSSFDGRDVYYHLDLARCAQSLVAAGTTLHPGLRLEPATGPRDPAPCTVLFLCTGNSARSQAAEALTTARSGGRVHAFSAGSHPKPLHPHAARVLAARGIEPDGLRPKHLSVFAERRFDYVITLCDRVREVCPQFPGDPGYLHWSIPDPAAGGATYPEFEQMAAELETRTGFWLSAQEV